MKDLIERQDAIDAINAIPDGNWSSKRYVAAIKELPPAQPEREKGKWVKNGKYNYTYKCSVCGETGPLEPIGEGVFKFNFCPNCGADMRGEQDEQEIIKSEFEQKCWIPLKGDEAAKRLNDLIFDINPAEICSQIESDNLRNWCEIVQTEMKMAFVQLPCWAERLEE